MRFALRSSLRAFCLSPLLLGFWTALSGGGSSARIVMMIGEDEYKTWETLPAFAQDALRPAGFHVTIVQADPADKNNFPGLVAALRDADLLIVSVRRRTPHKEQLDAVRDFLAAGRPLVGIRTACHAFSPLPHESVTDPRLAAWPSFDPEVLGGNYTGHARGGEKTTVASAPGADTHSITRGIAADKLSTKTPLYKVSPLAADARPILFGAIDGQTPEPVAWIHIFGANHARVFFTSLGGPADMAKTEFRQLLLNGIQWALDK